MQLLIWIPLCFAAVCATNETCHNYPTAIRPHSFREGEWIDQVRVYSGSGEFVSKFHPSNTVSMFMAKYRTNCGFYELNVLSKDSFELYKGYYASRFREYFFPFKAEFSRIGNGLTCKLSLEQRECDHYGDLNQNVSDVNVLYTDYKNLMVIHQCVEMRNYLMLLTRNDRFTVEDKAEIQKVLVDIMQDYKIFIENQTFWWPTKDLCAEYLNDFMIPLN